MKMGNWTRRELVIGGLSALGGVILIISQRRSPLERAMSDLESTMEEGGFFLLSMPGCWPCRALQKRLDAFHLPYKEYTLPPDEVTTLLQTADRRWGGFTYTFTPTLVANPYHGKILIAQGFDAKKDELVTDNGRVVISDLYMDYRRNNS